MVRMFNDPLLSVTQGLLRVAYIALFSIAALLAVAACFALMMDQTQFSTITAAQRHDGGILMLAIVPSLAVFGVFLRILRQIVRTVAEGTPFVAVNASRLTGMGWLVLLLKGIFIAEQWVLRQELLERSDLTLPNGSVMMALTLFILARVFRQGAAMRADLEGTI